MIKIAIGFFICLIIIGAIIFLAALPEDDKRYKK